MTQAGRALPPLTDTTAPADHGSVVADAFHEIGLLLAVGYLRLLANRGVRGDGVGPGAASRISLDLSGEPSDELDRQQRPRRPRCKQI